MNPHATKEPLKLFRKTRIGQNLNEVLIKYVNNGSINEETKDKFLKCFDKKMCEQIEGISKCKGTIKGKVTSFSNCDDIWIFVAKEVSLKVDKETYVSPKIKIIAVDTNLMKKDDKNEIE